MPLPDLTTLGQVTRSVQDFPERDEVKIAEWITAASDMIRNETGREFRAPPEVIEQTIETYGGSRVYVPELLAPESIEWVRDEWGSPRRFRFSQPRFQRDKGAYIVLDQHWNPRAGVEGLGPGMSAEVPWEHRDYAMRNFPEGYSPSAYGNSIILRARIGYERIPPTINLLCERAVRRWYYAIANFGHTVEREESGIPGEILPPAVLNALRGQKWVLGRRAVLLP